MEKFNLFQAKNDAESYVHNIYNGTSTVSAVLHVAVDSSYRCLSVPELGDERKLVEQQCACIFTVRYNMGTAYVSATEYINKEFVGE